MDYGWIPDFGENLEKINEQKAVEYVAKKKIADADRALNYLKFGFKPDDIFHINKYESDEILLDNLNKLNLLILVLYTYIKKVIRNSDHYHANFLVQLPVQYINVIESRFDKVITRKRNNKEGGRSILKYFDKIEQNNGGYISFEYVSYDLACKLREYDGNINYNDIDSEMLDDEDHPHIEALQEIFHRNLVDTYYSTEFLTYITDVILPGEDAYDDDSSLPIADHFYFMYEICKECVGPIEE